MKLVIMGPVSLVLLIRARTQEAVARRNTTPLEREEAHERVVVSS